MGQKITEKIKKYWRKKSTRGFNENWFTRVTNALRNLFKR